MATCVKCKLEIDRDAGYAQCQGCNQRYHFGNCSVSSSTWRAKGQEAKDSWRCESCRKSTQTLSEVSAQSGQIPAVTPQSSDGLKSVKETLQMFSKEQDAKMVGLKGFLTNQSNSIYSNLEKLIKAIGQDLKTEVKNMEAAHKKLAQDNEFLKSELLEAREKIETLELKMKSSLPLSQSQPTVTHVQQKSDANGRARVTNPQYNVVVASSSSLQPTSGVLGASLQSTSGALGASPQPTSGRSPAVPRDGNSDNGWVQVNRRKQRNGSGDVGGDGVSRQRSRGAVPKIGKRSAEQLSGSQSLPMVRTPMVRERMSALFVSRFAATVSSEDIKTMVQNTVSPTLSHLKVTKIKTRYMDLYSSFHVEVQASDFEKIDNVDVWPDGCLIKPYYGKLISDVVVNEIS